MAILLNELAGRLPSDLEKRVDQTKKQFLQAIQGELRRETGLLLNRNDREDHSQQASISIPVKLAKGIPAALAHIEFDPAYWLLAPLVPYRSLLLNLSESGTPLAAILDDLDDDLLPQAFPKQASSFQNAGEQAKALVDLIDKIHPVKIILGINEDVLGSYDYTNPLKPKIYLYWAVIGIVANLLNIRPEALACVVLAHELAHGYSHVGTDIDGYRWETTSFARSELALAEGLAQYYTHLICARLDYRIPGVFDAYHKMLKDQPMEYRVHMDWVANFSPEIVRMAFIETRRKGTTSFSDFEILLKDAAAKLSN